MPRHTLTTAVLAGWLALGVTSADVTVLVGDDRITELARMLGGDPESDVSRAHAREPEHSRPF